MYNSVFYGKKFHQRFFFFFFKPQELYSLYLNFNICTIFSKIQIKLIEYCWILFFFLSNIFLGGKYGLLQHVVT